MLAHVAAHMRVRQRLRLIAPRVCRTEIRFKHLTVPLLTVMGSLRSSKAEGFTSTFFKLIRPDAAEIDRSFASTFLQNLSVHPPTL
jgi:hypothetical protein